MIYSYTALTTLLFVATWFAFPLSASPQAAEAQVVDDTGVTVNTGGPILKRNGIQYPLLQGQARTEGTVVLELTLNELGEVSDARVHFGPQELRRYALQSVLGWRYDAAKMASRTVMVTVRFATSPNSGVPMLGSPTGTLFKIDVSAMPEPLQGLLAARLRQFEGLPNSSELMRQITQVVRAEAPNAGVMLMPLSMMDGKDRMVRITPQSYSVMMQQSKQFDPTPGVKRVRIGQQVAEGNLLTSVKPEYPALAKQARIQAVVQMDVLIGQDGHVSALSVVSGHPLLIQAAQDAVRQNVYRPTLLNGNAVEVQTQVGVSFTLPN